MTLSVVATLASSPRLATMLAAYFFSSFIINIITSMSLLSPTVNCCICQQCYQNKRITLFDCVLCTGEGNGFKIAMNILNSGRFVISSLMAGTIKLCIERATEHVATRTQFGRTLDGFEGIQEKIARM